MAVQRPTAVTVMGWGVNQLLVVKVTLGTLVVTCASGVRVMVTLAVTDGSGFCMVRYSWKPPPTLPPSKYQVVLAGVAAGN